MQATLAGNSAVLVSCVNGKLLELLGETTFGRTYGGGYFCSAASGGYLWECVRGRALTPCRGRAALQHDGRRDGPRLQLSALMLCVFEGCVRDVYCVDLGTGVHKIGLSTFAKD